jgi:hypothetical protein
MKLLTMQFPVSSCYLIVLRFGFCPDQGIDVRVTSQEVSCTVTYVLPQVWLTDAAAVSVT